MPNIYLPKWKAYWIWGSMNPVQPDTYVYFRKSFYLEADMLIAFCSISADSEYSLYINGKHIGHGPVMSEPRWKTFDVYDIKETLSPGENVICVVVYHYGNGLDGHEALTAYDSQGGLLCQIDCYDEKDNNLSVFSNSSWLYMEQTAWEKSGRKFDRISYCESYNANKEPSGWMENGFDINQWRNSLEINATKGFNNALLPSYKHLPWIKLEPRNIPYLEYRDEIPVSVINIGEIAEMGIADSAAEMALQQILPSRYTSFENIETLTEQVEKTIIVNPMDHSVNYDYFNGVYHPTLTLDFGKLINGRINFIIEVQEMMNIDIGYGQRLIQGKVMPYFSPKVIQEDHYTAKKGRQFFETFNWRNFRYVQLSFKNMTKPLKVSMLKAVSVKYPYENGGTFECSDEMLNWIWMACRDTAKICTYDRLMDNPNRERREYSGDIANMVYAIYACFGNSEIILKYLDDIKKGQPSYGLFPWAVLGLRPEFNRTLTDGNSLVIKLLDFYKLSGNIKIIEDMFQPALASVKNLEEHINEQGLLEEIPYSIWVDWAEVETKGIPLVINVTFAQTLKVISEMALILNEKDVCKEYRSKHEKLVNQLNSFFWDDTRGVYIDSVINGETSRHISEQCNFLMMLYGFAEQERVDRIIKYLDDPKVDVGQIEALQFYPAEALFKTGEGIRAIEMMKKRYCRIRRQGFDTISEVWNISGIRSNGKWECPYMRSVSQSGGTISSYFLSKYILGISPLEIGFKRVLISPGIYGLEWAKGVWPSPFGSVIVDWKFKDYKYSLKCCLPEGINGEVELPFKWNEIKKLIVNGSKLDLQFCKLNRIPVNGETLITFTI